MIPVQYVLIAVVSCLGTSHAFGTECNCRCDNKDICESTRSMKTAVDLNVVYLRQWTRHSNFVQRIHDRWDDEVESVVRHQLEVRFNETRDLLNSCLASQNEAEKSIQKISLSIETLEKQVNDNLTAIMRSVENVLETFKKEFANVSNQQITDKMKELLEKLCKDNTCKNGGTCYVEEDLSYRCECEVGFKGTHCDEFTCTPTEKEECGEAKCEIKDSRRKVTCVCPIGEVFDKGNKKCKENPCKDDTCINGGMCHVEEDLSYTCECEVGFKGTHCDEFTCTPTEKEECGEAKCEIKDSSRKVTCVCPIGEVFDNRDKKCKARSCGDPGYLNNGQRKGNLFTFPNKVEYECDEGYKLRGLSTRYCQAGGEWSGRLPTCELIYCNAPTNPANGRVSYSSLEYGTELKYDCNAGFLLKKHQPRICSEDGRWSNEEPECIEATCDEPQTPKHGSVKLHGELKVGSIATYSCDPDRKLHGATTTKCLISGKWTFDAPDCLSTCTVSFIENGEIGRYETRYTRRGNQEEFKKVVAGSIVNSGETLFFRCKDDFLPLEGSQFVTSNRLEMTCIDGTWSKDLQCKSKRCTGSPPPSKNASPVIQSREHGYTIYYTCKFDDVVKIPGNVTCHLGSWIGIPPKCLSSPCYTKDLNYPGLVRPSQEYFESFESFDISCGIGYRETLRMQRITCTRGSWNVPQNPCSNERRESGVTVTTDKMNVPHGEIQPSTNVESSSPRTTVINRECVCSFEMADNSVTVRKGDTQLNAGDTIKLGENASFECKPGKFLTWQNDTRLSGENYMTCSTCMRWRREHLPTCSRATGFTVIYYDGVLKILPGGVIEVRSGETLRFICISPWKDAYPAWDTGRRRSVTVRSGQMRGDDGKTYYISYMDISQAAEMHAGKYVCFVRGQYGGQLGTTSLYLKVNAEGDRSISSLGPRVTSSTTEIPTNINLEASTRATSGLIPNKDCSCMYEHEDESVNAQIGNKILKFGDEIKIGEKVSFQCKYTRTFLKFQNGLRLQSTTANMTCTACKKWKKEDVPTCENSEQSDSLIGFGENLNILPGGNTSVQQGVIHRFSCSNNWKQPEWNYIQRKGVSVTKTSVPGSEKVIIYIAYLDIQKEATELNGQYECYIHDNQGHRKSTFLHLQVTDYVSVSCPEFSSLSELRVDYSNGVSVGSIATFSCSVTTKTLTGSNNSICQGDGVWSNPLPSCEDSKCSIGDLSQTVPENVVPDISEDVEEHVTIGSVVRLKCIDNEVMTGEREAQCGEEGKWKLGSFQCVPGCVLDLDSSSHLQAQPIKDSYRIGDFVLLSCPPGQEMSHKVERIMCMFGGWTDSLPECKEKSSRR